MKFSSAVLFAAFASLFETSLAASISLRQDLRSCVANAFKVDAEKRIVAPEDDLYTDARLGEKVQFDQYPLLVAYAISANEVGPLIKCAQAAGVKAVPRTGGHHFEAYSSLSGTLVIDVSHIDAVTVSDDQKTAVVGGGIRLGALYTALDAYNTSFVGGICPTVGLSGFLGSGGFNMQMRALGLAVDHVVAAKVVTADGVIVTASATTNADLFFAIRGGGGGTYGIVVEWTLSLVAMPRSAMVMISWNDTNVRYDVAKQFLDWAPRADSRFTSQVNVYNKQVAVLGWFYGGTKAELQALIASSGLEQIGEPVVQISGGCSTDNSRLFGYTTMECETDDSKFDASLLNVVPDAYAAYKEYPQFRYKDVPKSSKREAAPDWGRYIRLTKSFYVQKDNMISDDTLEAAIDMIGQLDDESQIWGEWHAWNITTGSPGKGQTAAESAFAWRDQAWAHLEFQIHGTEDKSKNQMYEDWMTKLEAYLRPRIGHASYSGYMDAKISSDPLTSYYGSNLHRLSQIKARYDPNEFFTNPMSVKSQK